MGSDIFAYFLSASAVIGFGAVDARAELTSGPAEARDNNVRGGLDEIVVTARRREEALQSVPIAIQAFSGDALEERNVTSATDLQRIVPSLTTFQQARDEVTLSIRGLSSSGASAQGQNPRVTAYFAQVPLQAGDGGGPGRYFDLQNVQVLKGPQGTLFGRNSTGGALLYEPRRPSTDLEAYVEGQIGRFDERQFEAALNLPVTDGFALRFAGKRSKRDGFTRNLTNGQRQDDRDYLGLRASALFAPSDGFESHLMFDYLESDTNGSSQQIAGFDANKVFAADVLGGRGPRGIRIPLTLGGNGPSLAQFAANPAATIPLAIAAGRVAYFPTPILENQLAAQNNGGPRITLSGVDGVSRTRSWGITNISTVQLGDDLMLKNIAGLRRFKQLSRYDFDGTALPILDQTTPDGWSANLRQISEELQLQGKALDGKLDFTIGGFLLWQNTPDPQVLTQVSLGVPARTISEPKESSQAVFGQFTYDLSDEIVDGLSFTAGYRYTHDTREVVVSNFRDPAGQFGPATCSMINGCPSEAKASFNASSYNFSLDYQATPDTLIYLAHRRGYRAGGLNPQAANFGFTYEPETVTDFEAGLKTDFTIAGMSARTNFAIFHTKLDDAQVPQAFSTINPTTNLPSLINLIVNAATATINGLEIDATLAPAKGLKVSASYAFTDAGYDDFINLATGQPETDRPFPFVARHRFNVGASYTLPLSDKVGELTFAADWAYSSSYSLSVFADPLGVENGYDQLDLRADWKRIGGTNVSAGLFVTNVTNEVYKIGGVPIYSVLGTTSVIYNEPRSWGLRLRYRFGE